MRIHLVYTNNTLQTIDASVGVNDEVIVLVGHGKHPQSGKIVEVITASKAKVRMPDGNEVIFNKNRIRLPRSKE